MRNWIFILLISISSLNWSQDETNFRKQVVQICYNRSIHNSDLSAQLLKESKNYSKETQSLTAFVHEVVKTREKRKNKASDYVENLINLLNFFPKWEKDSSLNNLIVGYEYVGNVLYDLKINEYALSYFLAKLDLSPNDSTLFNDIYKTADSYLLMQEPKRAIELVYKFENALQPKSVREDSLLYLINKTIVEANIQAFYKTAAFAKADENIELAKKLSLEIQLEAYLHLAQIQFDQKSEYAQTIKRMENHFSKKPQLKRRVLEEKIQFYFRNNLIQKGTPLLESYFENYPPSNDLNYIEVLSYQALVNYDNKRFHKAFKQITHLLKKYEAFLSRKELAQYEKMASIAAETIGRNKLALKHLKKHNEIQASLKEGIIAEEKDQETIVFWFNVAQNKVTQDHRFQNFATIKNQKNTIQIKNDSLQIVEKERLIAEQTAERRFYVNVIIFLAAISLLIFLLIFRRSNRINKNLLLNILPKEIAEEVRKNLFRSNKKDIIQDFDQATILFTDFKGFTMIAEELSPKELVSELNECFAGFDAISEKHNLEKIKTIGDAYMAAGGIPVENTSNPFDAVEAALDIIDFIDHFNKTRITNNQPLWNIRIGINTGHIVAGIIGTHKYSYDVWGDAVNLASRMESSGEPGKVNISEHTYNLVKHKYRCTYRGEVDAKNKGKVKMYFVEGRIDQ